MKKEEIKEGVCPFCHGTGKTKDWRKKSMRNKGHNCLMCMGTGTIKKK